MYNNTMATTYREPGDTDDFSSHVEEGDTKPVITAGFVNQMVKADGTMGPVDGTEIIGGFTIPPHNHITLTQNSTQDSYVFRKGGASGTVVATLTIHIPIAVKGPLVLCLLVLQQARQRVPQHPRPLAHLPLPARLLQLLSMPFVFNPFTGKLDAQSVVAIGDSLGTANSVLFIDASGNLAESNPGFTYDGTDLTIVGDLTVNTLNYTTLNPVITAGATIELDNLGTVAINTSLISDTDSTDDLGSSSIFWANAFVDKLFLNATATLDGATAGQITTTGDIIPSVDSADWLGKENLAFARIYADIHIIGPTITEYLLLSGTNEIGIVTDGSFRIKIGKTTTQFLTTIIGNSDIVSGSRIRSDTDSTDDLGDSSHFWKDLYIDNIAGPTVFNEVGADVDFRFETDALTHALFIDASTNDVLIDDRSVLRYAIIMS